MVSVGLFWYQERKLSCSDDIAGYCIAVFSCSIFNILNPPSLTTLPNNVDPSYCDIMDPDCDSDKYKETNNGNKIRVFISGRDDIFSFNF